MQQQQRKAAERWLYSTSIETESAMAFAKGPVASGSQIGWTTICDGEGEKIVVASPTESEIPSTAAFDR